MNSEDYIKKLNMFPVQCDCEKCSLMCRCPCCGSVEDFEKIIAAGYADRLMFDDLPSSCDAGPILKPALKGHEGKGAPWGTGSERGCTFWKEGKCELHESGLKPIQGKIAHHDNERYYYDELAEIMKEDWGSMRGMALIEKWKDLVNFIDEEWGSVTND